MKVQPGSARHRLLSAASAEPRTSREQEQISGVVLLSCSETLRMLKEDELLARVSGTGIRGDPYRYVLTPEGERVLDEAFST